ncbi:MAG: hypothetical protein EOO70_03115 [Myxococcaceae bacterium]|nr:MAG: hypothetical protein EOO70_03115 [Myxococcaceae bacterium]
MTQEAFDAQYPSLVCRLLAGCCKRLGIGGSFDPCLDKQSPPKHEGYTFDPVQAGLCAATVDSIDNTGGIYFCDDPSRGLRLPSCEKAYVYSAPTKGQIPALGTCKDDADCKVPDGGSARCTPSSNGSKRCEVTISVALGEECGPQTASKPERLCADDQFCDAKHCVLRPVGGESCGSQFQNVCAPGLYCDQAIVCQPSQANGASCSHDADCEGFCDDGTSLCTSPKADGEPCGQAALSRDCLSGYCIDFANPAAPPSAISGTCSPFPLSVVNACKSLSSP